MPLDPAAAAYLERAAALPRVETLSPLQARANAEAGAPTLAGPPPEIERAEDIEAGGVPARLYSGGGAGAPLLVWYHGGGWVLGSLDTHDVACRHLALQSGCDVLSVGYRLAPEHPYPAAVEDAWAALGWALERSPRVAVGGDSAGGNLAAVMALRARDRGLDLRAQLLVYPVLDHDFATSSYAANGEGYGLTRPAMRWYWDQYLPEAGRRSEPEASPLRAPDLTGLAHALVVVCEFDPLLDEGAAYARRLEGAGVQARLLRLDGQIHGLLRLTAQVPASHDLLAAVAAEARGQLR